MKKRLFLSILAVLTATALPLTSLSQTDVKFGTPYEFAPPGYVCYRAPQSEITIDGDIDTPEWDAVPWTSDFIDIQGKNRLVTPRFQCRAKLMWDDKYLYIAAEMIEPHIWGTLTERESVIFIDNDFEVFLDVLGTTHNYMEYEVNALGTEWDLLLTRPYRDGGAPLNAWNMNGMRSAVKIYGTLNDPSDTDEKWTFEMAIPLSTLQEVRHRKPEIQEGEQWRLNFSRVQWHHDIKDGKYVKRPNTPEDNWVWAPTGKINIHEPEYWGFLQFTDVVAGKGTTDFVYNRNEDVKWALRELYYRQGSFRKENGRYATTSEELKAADIKIKGLEFAPTIYLSGKDSYSIITPGFDDTSWYINNEGRVGQGR